MARPHARKPLTSLIIRLSGGRRLRLTLRPRPRISRALLMLLGSALGWPAYAQDGAALPQGGQVAAGQASISQGGAHMTIRQGSDKAVLNWQSFNIGSQAKVEFQQPSSSSVALNRVLGNQASQIYGQLQANGQVFLSNPNGVVFAPGSRVNVGGLVATTLSLGDQDFIQGRYQLAGDSQAAVSNAGQITAGASVALVAATVRNSGSIQAGGDVALAAGQRVSLDLHGDGLLSLNVEASALRGQVENGAAIQAGNQVLLTAAAADDLIGSVVNNSGIVKASGLSVAGGKISLSGGLIAQTGTLDASSAAGGQVEIRAHTLQDAGQTLAKGSSGQGGSVRVVAQQITQISSAHISVDGQAGGGDIHLQGGSGEGGKLYSSATLTAQGLADSAKGGGISVTANSTQLRAATLDASGQAGGGSIQVGGGWQGQDAEVTNARETGVNASTQLSADAKRSGDGGTVVVWSDKQTTFAGHISAQGGSQSGNGGQLEVSGKENLTFAGTVNTASPFGLGGSLLLDPKNIVISDAAALFDVLNLDDPNAGAGNFFGQYAVEVGGGNIAVTAHASDIGGVTNTGAAYLFDGETGALLASLYGSTASDSVGNGGVTVLSDGAYVVRSTNWDNVGMTNAGAATYGAAGTGVSGVVSAANSLVGSSAYDQVGWVVALSDGAYVAGSRFWDNGTVLDAGAVTYGAAGSALTGTIDASNSLVGSTDYDEVSRVIALTNGAYVVASASWDNGDMVDVGAVTYGAAGTALTGTIDTGNSLLGSRAGNRVGIGGVTALSDGSYVVSSYLWDSSNSANVGAVTYGAAGTALTGTIDESNSLVGGGGGDQVGIGGITALSDGAYVVRSHTWRSIGAVTYGVAGMALTGIVSSSNSLVGSSANDRVGEGGVVALSNGAYVVSSYNWDNGGVIDAGAVTYGAAGMALIGTVDTSNSLVGSSAGDRVGRGITALSNGAYVVRSDLWDNAGIFDVGAATYGAAGTGISGVVNASNSLVGSTAHDSVGSVITALNDGAYVVASPYWDNGTVLDAGAVTYGVAGLSLTGTIDASNSLVGSTAYDRVGFGGGTALSDGTYVVRSQYWDNAGIVDVGAATFGTAGTALTGSISAANSLVGSAANDQVSSGGVVALSAGRVLVSSPNQRVNGINTGRVSLVDFEAALGDLDFLDRPSADFSIHPNRIAEILNGGTSLTLQASNDITLASALLVDNAAGNGGHLTLQAGRHISFNANLTTDNGDLTAIAGDPNALVAHTDPGMPTLTIANGVTLDMGTGTATLAAIGGNFVNNAGSGAIQTSGAGRYLIYSSDPAASLEGLSGYGKHYNQGFALGSVPAYASSGNWFLYSVAPVLSITPDASAQVYGDLDLAGLGYGLSGFIDGDDAASSGLSGSALFTSTATAGSGVGSYDLGYVSGLASSLGYGFADASASTDELSITPRAISLAADAASKVYGEADPGLGVTVSAGSLAAGDSLAEVSGSLSRELGENVGSYDLVLGTGLKAGNYTISFDADNNAISITPRAISLAATAGSKVYGEADPALGVTVSAGSMAAGDSLAEVSGSLSREAGENVGVYDLALGTGLKAGNYTISFNADNNAISITPRAISLSATAGSKVYGEADPGLAVSVSAGSLATGDSLAEVSGNLSRAVGENVGSYDIALGAGLKAGNYTISFAADNNAISITPRAISLSADAASKVYGEVDPSLGVTVSAGSLAAGDSLAEVSGSLSREAGENVGSYDITLGTGLKAGNYTISFSADNNAISITPRAISLTADAASKVYGEADPALGVTVSGGSLAASDSLTEVSGSLSREAGENVGVYDIALGTGLKAGNYTISFAADNNAISITPRAISLSADAASKVYGEADPSLGVTVSAGSLAAGDSLTEVSGSLSREAGENVGSYDIALGTGLKAGNYTISFDADNNAISITPRAISLAATAGSKVYGEADPALGVTVSAGILAAGDSLAEVSGSLSREIGENVGVYDIALGTALKAGNYTISFDADNNAISITPKQLVVTANDAERYQGEANPAFSATFSGWAFDDDQQDLQGDLVFTTLATAASAVGDYGVSPAGLSADNYALSFNDGTLRVLAQEPVAQPIPGPESVAGVDAAQQQVASLNSSPLLTPRGEEQPMNDVAELLAQGIEPLDGDGRVPAQAALSAGSAGGGVLLSTFGNLLIRNQGIRLPTFSTQEEL